MLRNLLKDPQQLSQGTTIQIHSQSPFKPELFPACLATCASQRAWRVTMLKKPGMGQITKGCGMSGYGGDALFCKQIGVPLKSCCFFLKESDIWLIFHTDHAYSDPSSPPRNACSPVENSCPGRGGQWEDSKQYSRRCYRDWGLDKGRKRAKWRKKTFRFLPLRVQQMVVSQLRQEIWEKEQKNKLFKL